MLVGQGNLHGVEVFALYVLDERHFHDVLVVGGANVGGDAGKSGQLRGAEAPFAGNELVVAIVQLPQGDGLYDAYLGYGVGQLLQGHGVELAARLVGVDLYFRQFYLVDGAGAARLHFVHREEGVQPAS